MTNGKIGKNAKSSKPKKRGRRSLPKPNFNRVWFSQQLERAGLTQAALAKKLGYDASMVSVLFRGERHLGAAEAVSLAELFDVPLDEVLTHAGVPVPPRGASSHVMPVEGWLDQNLHIHWGTPAGPKTVEAPFYRKSCKAVRAQTRGSRFESMDGWVFFFKPAFQVMTGLEDEICVVRVAKEKEFKLRVVKRGYSTGRYTLVSLAGEVLEQDVELESGVAVESILVGSGK